MIRDPLSDSYLRALGMLDVYTQRELAVAFNVHRPEISTFLADEEGRAPTTDLEREAAELRRSVEALAAKILDTQKAKRQNEADILERLHAKNAAIRASVAGDS